MKVFAFMTGERHTPESIEHGDAEERGWVDPRWSKRTFWESRNDVRPVMEEWMPHDNLPDVLRPDDLGESVREALAELGAFTDNGDGTFYAADAEEDFETGNSYTYALHFVAKDGSGERGWHPSEAGIETDPTKLKED